MPSHCDTGSLTTFPQAGAGLGGRGPWLGEHSKIRVLAQMCRAAPVSKILSSVYSWVVGWPGIWAFYSRLPTPPRPPPVLRSSTALKDSFLSCLLRGETHSQAQSKGHFSWGYQSLLSKPGLGCTGDQYPGTLWTRKRGVEGRTSQPPLQSLGRRETGAVTGLGQETAQCSRPLSQDAGVAQSLRTQASQTSSREAQRVPIYQGRRGRSKAQMDLT